MIAAVIFDLDGTLIKTERLKARAYARAAGELRPELAEAEVVEAFKDVVGRSRREVATGLLERFELEAPAAERIQEFGVTRPWQAYVQIRLGIQEEMLADPDVLRDHRWEHTDALLRTVGERRCRTALATMSYCEDAARVLDVLELRDHFEFVATRDDVDRPKPDPEIYRLVTEELDVEPARSLAIEDSPAGVRAAVAAGTEVVALGTPFTRDHLLAADYIPDRRVALGSQELCRMVEEVLPAGPSGGGS